MIVYLVLFAAILFAYVLTGYNANAKSKKHFLIICAILIIAVLGSRHNWYSFSDEGMYYLQYEEAMRSTYDEFVNGGPEEMRDVGYMVMVWCIAQVIPWAQFILYLECAVVVCSYFYFVYKNTKNSLNAVLLFFGSGLLTFYMSAFRQGFAFALCLFAYQLFESAMNRQRGRLLRNVFAILLLLIAITMHRSACLFVMVFIIQHIRVPWAKIVISLGASAIAFVFRELLLDYGSELGEKDYAAGAADTLIGFVLQMIIYLMPFVLLLLHSAYGQRNRLFLRNDYNTFAMSSLVGTAFYVLRMFSYTFERITHYFSVFSLLIYESTADYVLDKKTKNIFLFVINVMAVFLFLYRVATNRHGGAFTFFWQH